jgi:hypothetical protein
MRPLNTHEHSSKPCDKGGIMNNRLLWSVVVVLLIASGAAPSFAVKSAPPTAPAAAAPANDAIAAFQKSWAWKNVDPALQSAWLDAMQRGAGTTRFQCFVRIKDVMDPGDQSFLIDKGFNVRIFEGNVVRGDVAAKDLQSVAELPFVGSIKLAAPAE